MKKRIVGITVIMMVLGVLLLGCSTTAKKTTVYNYVPSFKLMGDVEEVLTVTNMEDFQSLQKEIHGEERTLLSLQQLIEIAKPVPEEYELLLVGQDGLMARIDGKGIEECYVGFSQENVWELINPKHPVSSNIKKLKEVLVISKKQDWDYGVNIINSEENFMNITPGNLYSMPSTIFPYFEGKSSIQHQQEVYETSIYTEQKILRLKEILPSLVEEEKILAMGALGEYQWFDIESYLKMLDNKTQLFDKEGKIKINDIQGLIFNPPSNSIMDTYYDSSYFLKQNEKVLILFLDGFGYHQYRYALEHGYAPFLKTLQPAKKATSVYQSVTNAGFAAMITGKPPYENGVYSRRQRELKTPSIFAVANELKKQSILIEGDMKILNTEIEPILNIDRNKNGMTDDEVFESAIKNLTNQQDLMLVHFHGIDDMGHRYGDLHEKTMERIQLIDGYIQELVARWNGKVIITADHGMHTTDEGGNHGSFRYEDMIVPYLLTEGGDQG